MRLLVAERLLVIGILDPACAIGPCLAIDHRGGRGYPVTVSDCGSPVTYTQAPTRAVSNDINATEDMIALGLESHMVGEFAASGSLPANQPFPAEFAAGFKQIREISPDYFTLEQLVGQHPDFLFAGWNYGLQTGTTLTPDNLAKYGIKTLALTESCAHVQTSKQSVSVDDTYQDLTDLGQIFGIPQKAQQVINSMKAQIATAQSKVASSTAGHRVRLRQRHLRPRDRARAGHAHG